MNTGKITQIVGPVIDVEFPSAALGANTTGLPAIYNALILEHEGKTITLEVQQHIGYHEVRTVAMTSTDGLSRGMTVTDTGAPISVPVGNVVLGRMFDVTGQAIDELPTP